jgi:hypothetical protein
MSLVQVATETVTSAVASVTLTGIDSDDVYMLAMNNVAPASDNYYLRIRFTESGTPNSTSNYDYAMKYMQTNGSFLNLANTNGDGVNITNHTNGTGTSETTNGIFPIYNANNSSEYTFMTTESTNVDSSASAYGTQGGLLLTVTSAVDGVYLYYSTGNIASGTFTLYRQVGS